MQPSVHPLVGEAMKKAAVAWVGVPGRSPYPVWCLWLDGSLYVVGGPGEQPAPGLAVTPVDGTVTVTARGDHGGRIVTWPATVTRVEPDSDEWNRVVPQLASKRLNAPGDAYTTARHWAARCAVHRLVPAGDPHEAGRPHEAGSPAATR